MTRSVVVLALRLAHLLGWAGVLLLCSLCGWMLGKLLYSRYVEGPQRSFHTIAHMMFLSMLVLALRDGQLITVVRQGLFYMAPIVFWWGFTRLSRIPSARMVRARQRRRLAPAGDQLQSRGAASIVDAAAVRQRRWALANEKACCAPYSSNRRES